MNGFHVNAVGWVLIFNARILSPRESEEVSGLWGALVRAYAEDKSQTPTIMRMTQPRSIPLSEKSLEAFAGLVDRLAALHAERFGWAALRARRNHWALQSTLSLVLGILGARWLPTAVPLGKEAVVAFILLGLIFVVPTVMLWRAASAVHSLIEGRHSSRARPHSLSSPWTQSEEGTETVELADRSRTSNRRDSR